MSGIGKPERETQNQVMVMGEGIGAVVADALIERGTAFARE